jgi:hypothetical protein
VPNIKFLFKSLSLFLNFFAHFLYVFASALGGVLAARGGEPEQGSSEQDEDETSDSDVVHRLWFCACFIVS